MVLYGLRHLLRAEKPEPAPPPTPMRRHQPWQRYYDVTAAEECMATTAQAAGYRAAKV